MLPTNGIILFTRNNKTLSSYTDFVYSYDGTSITTLSNFKNPSSFVVTTDNTSICMVGYYYTDNNDEDGNIIDIESSSSIIACYNGGTKKT